MYINLHLTGELEEFINELVSRGLVSNKTEAVRLSILKHYSEFHFMDKENKKGDAEEAKRFALGVSEYGLKKIWDNDQEEKFWSRYY